MGQEAVDPRDLAEALGDQHTSHRLLGQILRDRGHVSDAALARALSQRLGLPLVDLGRTAPDQAALALLSEAVARAHQALPLRAIDGFVHVILADPTPETMQAVRAAVTNAATQLLGSPGRVRVEFLIASAGEVRRALDSAYMATESVQRLVSAFEASEARSRITSGLESVSAEADAPVVRVVNLIMTQGLRDRASDIHIEPQDGEIRVRFRVDGALHDALALPGSIGPALISRLKILADMNIVERRRAQDGQFTLEIDERSVDVRVATVNTIWGEKCVLRLLDKGRALLKLDDLGMPPETHATFSRLARSPFGMVLCAGPTGSGKTTTLYAALAELNEAHRNIMTIED
ncbi:MAG: ATPase, T2SS/T4P/T4SS family, partial [Acidimicrobiales bacterium]